MTTTSGRSRSTRRRSAPPCSFARPTRRCASTRADPPSAGSPYLDLTTLERALVAARADARLGWVGLRRRAPGVRGAVRAARHRVHRSRSSGDAPPRRQDRGQATRRAVRRSRCAVERRAGGVGRGCPLPRRRDRVPPDDQGHRGRRRPGHPARRCRRRAGGGLRQRPGRRAEGVRRCDRLHGAGRDRCTPRRGAGDGRPPWHGVGGRGPRLQLAAAQPEGDRGVAVHRADARRRSRSASRRHPPRHGVRIRERRNRRVPLPAGDPAARVPRGEHPPPGGASRHRADDWARPREAADPRRQRRSAGGRPARHRRATPSKPG